MNVYMGHGCLVPIEARRGIDSPGTGVKMIYELPCGCWDPNLGPVQEQQCSPTLGF